MKKRKKLLSLLLAGVMMTGLLAGCVGDNTKPSTTNSTTGSFDINVCVASEPQTMDPTLSQTLDGGMMFNHLFEGLYKYVDDGKGLAVLAPGQAAGEPTITENADGTYTYTFKLRDDIKWSDGQSVKAGDFVYAWRRLVDPEMASPYNYMLNMVVNADAITDSKMPPDQLGVSAPDDKTFVVNLTYNCPYFLQVCAFANCMPLREDIITANPGTWTDVAKNAYISNGSYKMTEWVHNASIKMEKNENYYDPASQGPDSITWTLMDDNRAMLTAFNNGELDHFINPPVDEIPSLLSSGKLSAADNLATYYACFNNSKAPFDNPLVRKAFSLTIDRNYIVENVTQVGETPASGWVPSALDDVGGPTGDDYRTVGGDLIGISAAEYKANCEEARQLLAEAGYPNGEGFPEITYLFNTDSRHNAIAEALQQMWKTELGVTVKLNNQDWNVFVETRNKGDYNICRHGWTADYNDPLTFMELFVTGGGNNNAYYSNTQYDELIAQVQLESDAEKRMQMMHEAEKLLIQDDAGIAPIFFYTQPYLLSERVEGMYYTPLGYFFFQSTKPAA